VKLSVALAVFNEAINIRGCLSSIFALADEIVVVDGGSTDGTVDLVGQWNVKLIHSDNPPMFHLNKEKAIEACRGSWILQLDADEVVDASLADEIREIIRHPSHDGYYIPRKNFFWGHWMAKGGQYPDYVTRLFRNGKGRFPCKSLHEQIRISGSVGYLTSPLLHYSYKTLSDYWTKAKRYIQLSVKDMEERKVSITMKNWISYMLVKPIRTFFMIFIRHKGILDGIYGFLFALFSSLHFPISWVLYLKRRTA